MLLVKKEKEYNAINNGIYYTKTKIENLNSEKKEKQIKLEENRKKYEELMKKKKEMEKVVEEERKNVEEKLEELKPRYEQLNKRKEELYKEFNQDIQNKLKGIENSKKYKNKIIAKVNHGMCGACKMNLPPQTVAEIRKANKIYTCPYCGRLLYWDQDSK